MRLPVLLCALLLPAVASALERRRAEVSGQAGTAYDYSSAAAAAPAAERASAHGRMAFGERGEAPAVQGDGVFRAPALAAPTPAEIAAQPSAPPAPAAAEEGGGKKNIPSWAVYGGAAALGALQGFLSGGVFGALGGAVLGLAGAHMYQKGDMGAAFGITAGSILGSFLGGPIGALVGGLVGGIVGHFLGKLFG